MVIKINYTSSDVYVSTSVSPVYVVVSYGSGDSGAAIWGQITGTLSNQTDLQNALNAKFDDPTGTTSQYLRGDGSLATFPAIPGGTVTSVDMSVPTGLTISGNPITSAGTLAVGLASGYSIPTTASQANWNTAYNDSIVSAGVTGTTTKTLTLNQQDGGTVTASWTDINTDAVTSVFGRTGAVIAAEGDYTLTQLGDVTLTSPTNGQVLKYNGTTWVNNTDTDTGLTSVGLSMPVAFSVANTPLTANGTLAVSAVGTSAQYIRGDGQLATLPTGAGGGSSVNYYLNGSVNQGTIGGSVYYEMNRTPVIGAGTDFTRTNLQGDGLIAQFITDANDPNRLEIPAGAWNFEMYFNVSSAGGTPAFYLELLKYNGSTFTSIASGSTNPETITGGTAVDLYLSSLAVPQTTLLATDRLAIRVYVITSGRDITLHTEDNNLCEIITTFAGGVASLNGLTANTQYFAVGTTGTDFAISSLSDTHTFNLPTASAINRGALSAANWTTFNNKQDAITLTTTGSSGASTFISNTLNVPTYTLVGLGGVPTTRTITINGTAQDLSADRSFSVGTVTGTGTTNYLPKWASGTAIGNSLVYDDGTNVGIGTIPIVKLDVAASGIGIVRIKGGNLTNEGAAYYVGGNTVTLGAVGDRSAILGGTPEQAFSIYTGTVPLLFDVAGSERMRITPFGQVGIGTTSPNSNGGTGAGLLHINGAAAGAWAITHYTNGTTGFTEADGLIVGSIGSDAYIFNYENSPLLFGTNGSERIRITSGGNLLVGTTVNTGERLQVSGSVLASSFIKSGGTSSQYLMADGSVTTGSSLTITNRQAASYTLALTDADKLVEMNVATANNLTVPLNSSIAFAIGTKIDLAQYGAGQTTVVATGGVTVRSAGGALKLAVQYSGATLVKIATNEWYLFGDITV
jgi:hypothetical protein